MQEIQVKNNGLGVAIFLEDFPDLLAVPDDILNLLAIDLEAAIFAYVQQREKRKKYRDKKKDGCSREGKPP